MSLSQRRAPVSRAPASIVLGLLLASIVACHQRPAVPREPTSPETVSDGYGEKPKDQVGGTVTSVTFDNAADGKVSRVEELLERFPGVRVQRTAGGGYSVSIRGVGSFMASEEPLYVIDGVPIDIRPGSGLSWLNPSDVVRIDLLRNPVETSIYGVRGANGVVVITTKRSR